MEEAMNRSMQMGNATSDALARKFLCAIKLSPRQLQVAYPNVAALLQTLANPQPRSIRRRIRSLSLPRAAQA